MAKGRTRNSETLYNELRNQNVKGIDKISYDEFATGLKENRNFAKAIHRKVKEAQHLSTDEFLELTFPEDFGDNARSRQVSKSSEMRRSPDALPPTLSEDQFTQQQIQQESLESSPERAVKDNRYDFDGFPQKENENNRKLIGVRERERMAEQSGGRSFVHPDLELRKAVDEYRAKNEYSLKAAPPLVRNLDTVLDAIQNTDELYAFKVELDLAQREQRDVDIEKLKRISPTLAWKYQNGNLNVDTELTKRLKPSSTYIALSDDLSQDKKEAIAEGYDSVSDYYLDTFPNYEKIKPFLNVDRKNLRKADQLTFAEAPKNFEIDDDGTVKFKDSLGDFKEVNFENDEDLLDQYYSMLMHEYDRLSESVNRKMQSTKYGSRSTYTGSTMNGALDWLGSFGGEDPEYKRYVQVVKELSALSPLIAFGLNPAQSAPDQSGARRIVNSASNFVLRQDRNIGRESSQAIANEMANSLSKAGVKLDGKSMESLTASAKLDTWDKVQDAAGSTLGIVTQMMIAPGGNIGNSVKLFNQAKTTNKFVTWGLKAADEIVQTGINYQVAGLSGTEQAKEELNFGSGAIGGGAGYLAKSIFKPVMGKFFNEFVTRVVGAGAGEVAEETAQDLYQRTLRLGSFEEAKKEFLQQNFKDGQLTEDGVIFFGMSALMGGFMNAIGGADSDIGQAISDVQAEALASMTEEDLENLGKLNGTQTENETETETEQDQTQTGDNTSTTAPVDGNKPSTENPAEITQEATQTEQENQTESTEVTDEAQEESTIEEGDSKPEGVLEEETNLEEKEEVVTDSAEDLFQNPEVEFESKHKAGKYKRTFDDEGNPTQLVRRVRRGGKDTLQKAFMEDGELVLEEKVKGKWQRKKVIPASVRKAFNSKSGSATEETTAQDEGLQNMMSNLGVSWDSTARKVEYKDDTDSTPEQRKKDLQTIIDDVEKNFKGESYDKHGEMVNAMYAEIEKIDAQESGINLHENLDEQQEQVQEEVVEPEAIRHKGRPDVIRTQKLKSSLDSRFEEEEVQEAMQIIKQDIEADTLSAEGEALQNSSMGAYLKQLGRQGRSDLARVFSRLENDQTKIAKQQAKEKKTKEKQTRAKAITTIASKIPGLDKVRAELSSNSKPSKAVRQGIESIRRTITETFNSNPTMDEKASMKLFESLLEEHPNVKNYYGQLLERITPVLTDADAKLLSNFNSKKNLAKAIASNLLLHKSTRKGQLANDSTSFRIQHGAFGLGKAAANMAAFAEAKKAQMEEHKAMHPEEFEFLEESPDDVMVDENGELYSMKGSKKTKPNRNPFAFKKQASSGDAKSIVDLIGIKEISADAITRIEMINDALRNVVKLLQKNSGRARLNILISKMRGRIMGVYNTANDSIKVGANDIRTIIHEIGHYIDFNVSADYSGEYKGNDRNTFVDKTYDPTNPVDQELMFLGEYSDTTSAVADPNHLTRRREGLAVYFEAYLLNPENTRRMFPNLTAELDSAMDQDLKDAVDYLSDWYTNYLNSSASDQIAAHVGAIDGEGIPGRNSNAWKEFNERRKRLSKMLGWGAWLRAGLFDALFSPNGLYKKIARARGENVSLDNLSDANEAGAIDPLKNWLVLSRNLLGFNKGFSSMMINGLRNAFGEFERGLDGGRMTINWLLGAFDQTDAQTIKDEAMLASSIKIAKRIKYLVEKEEAKVAAQEKKIAAYKKKLKDYKKENAKRKRKGEKLMVWKGGPPPKPYTPKFKKDSTFTGSGKDGFANDYEQALKALEEFEQMQDTDIDKYNRVSEGISRYDQYAGKILSYMVDAGRISKEQYNKIVSENQEYVTMQRLMYEINFDESADQGFQITPGASTGFNIADNANVLHSFRGSKKSIVNPYAALISNAFTMIRESERNRAMSSWFQAMTPRKTDPIEVQRELTSIVQDVTPKDGIVPGTTNTIKVYIKGEAKYYKVSPELYNPLKNAYRATRGFSSSLPFKILAKGSQIFRGTIIYFPAFVKANLERDTLLRLFITGGEGRLNLKDYAANWKKEDKVDFETNGGAMAGFIASTHVDRYYEILAQSISELVNGSKKEGIFSNMTPQKAFGLPKEALDKYVSSVEGGENVNRLAEYKAAYREAKQKGFGEQSAKAYAAFKARDLMDFAVTGAWLTEIRAIMPFFNASLQGVSKLFRTLQANPVRFSLGLLALSGVSMALRMLVPMLGGKEAEEKYRNLAAYERDMYFNFFLGNKHIRIAKPFEAGVLASFGERAMSYLFLKEKNAFDGYNHSLSEKVFFPAMIANRLLGDGEGPTLFRGKDPYDSFRQAYVIPPWELGTRMGSRNTLGASPISRALLTWEFGDGRQFNDYLQDTSFGKFASSIFGREILDPRQFDHFLKSNFGYLASNGLRMSSFMNRTPEQGDKDGEIRPEPFGYADYGDMLLQITGTGKEYKYLAARDVQAISKLAQRYDVYRMKGEPRADLKKLQDMKKIAHGTINREKKNEISQQIISYATMLREKWEKDNYLEKISEKQNKTKRDKKYKEQQDFFRRINQ